MENELVGFACGLLDAPDSAVGTVTSGGTESILLAVQGARDAARTSYAPRMVLPATAHAAFHKAAHYFGVEAVLVPVGPDFRADAAAMAEAIDDDTVLVVASAPSYAHGVVDPVTEIAAAAAARGRPLPRGRLHRRLGAAVRRPAGAAGAAVDVRGRGRHVDLRRHPQVRLRPEGHLAPAAPRRGAAQAAVLRLRGVAGLHDAQRDDAVDASGGPVAGTWAVVEHIGDDGYLALAGARLAAVDAHRGVHRGRAGAPRWSYARTRPSSTLATDASCDPFTLTDELVARGWYVQPQLSFAGSTGRASTCR